MGLLYFQKSLALGVWLLAAPLVFAGASPRPPTLDPTYGLPPSSATRASTVPVSAARWIWARASTDNQTIFLRRTFDLRAAPRTAKVYITADDFFTLFINGTQVDQSRPDPKDKSVWQHVHQIDAAPYLRSGKNVLAVRVLNAEGPAASLPGWNCPEK